MSILLIIVIILVLTVLYLYIKKIIPERPFFSKLLLSLGVLLFSLGVVIYPEQSFRSALEGLNVWFNVVCPSLLPFFIGSQILISLGIVSFTGTLFEPVMRPLFRVPGCGSFPFMMSITSGYPVGSKIVADLYQNKMCSKIEAQRLLAFCSTSGPLFMIGAVGIGMFNMEESGIIIMISHYIGVLTVGILFRFYGYKSSSLYDIKPEGIKNALINFKSTLLKEKRPIGLLLSNAVNNSISSILTVGGFIILFSVIIRLLNQSGILNILSNTISLILTPIGMHNGLSSPIASGLLEMTVGSKLISSSQGPLIQKISAISGIIAWSGFSIHAQVASMISQTDLKISIYILSKALHMFFSGIYSFLIIKLGIIPVALGTMGTASVEKTSGWMESFASSTSVFVFSFMILIIAAIIIRTLLRLRSSITH